jgi:alkaline phosphatase/alkaline phosphatase D
MHSSFVRRLVTLLGGLSRLAFAQAQGDWAGEPTAHSVLLQTRLTAAAGPELDADGDLPGLAGVARFEVDTDPAFSNPRRTDWLRAEAERDFIVRAEVRDLRPATAYVYRRWSGADEAAARPGPVRRFRTLPGQDTHAPLSFAMGSCMNYHFFMSGKSNGGGPVTATEEDRRLGYPAFAALRALGPDFFIAAGDVVYYDHPTRQPARTPAELRRKWHEQFRFPRLVDFLGETATYWLKDDHDFRFNDADLTGPGAPDVGLGIDLFREQAPILPQGDRQAPTYRTHRVHPHLQLWMLEGRDHRSPNAAADGPAKSLWGPEQSAWLRSTLRESDATWKILISPTPIVGPDTASKRDNHANWQGFRAEGEAFLTWVKEAGLRGLLVFCGDRHWQYHSIHPGGVEEFGCGALNDENSIRGVRPGGAKTTDPEGRIRQPYLYPEPTGGFLHVALATPADGEPKLYVQFHDDRGAAGYQVEYPVGRP